MFVNETQSSRSRNPPCPGSVVPKSLMLFARLNPEARKPAKGATKEANIPMKTQQIIAGEV